MASFIGSVLAISLLIPTANFPLVQRDRQAPIDTGSRAEHAAAADGGWPRAYTTTSGARLVLYEPQIANWLNQQKMAMYAAVVYSSWTGTRARHDQD
jgi:hypothetical protein